MSSVLYQSPFLTLALAPWMAWRDEAELKDSCGEGLSQYRDLFLDSLQLRMMGAEEMERATYAVGSISDDAACPMISNLSW
jgi:hypothetical protein